jgi:hypothetical protein
MDVVTSAIGKTEALPTTSDLERAKVAFYFADEEWGRDPGNEAKFQEWVKRAMNYHLAARALGTTVHTELTSDDIRAAFGFTQDQEAFDEWLNHRAEEVDSRDVVEEDPRGPMEVWVCARALEQEQDAAAWAESNSQMGWGER